MLVLTGCDVRFQDALFPPFSGGRVIHNGGAATFWQRDATGKFNQVDRLTRVAVKEGDTYVFTGMSQHLRNDVNVPPEDATVTVYVTSKGGCPTC